LGNNIKVWARSFKRPPLPRGGIHPLRSRLEESSSLGSGAILGRGSAGSGLGVASFFRVKKRPRKPINTKLDPPIISQCGNSINESHPMYFFALY
jgi:hypothetical protein